MVEGLLVGGAVLLLGLASYIFRKTLGARLCTGGASVLCFASAALLLTCTLPWAVLLSRQPPITAAAVHSISRQYVASLLACCAAAAALALDAITGAKALVRVARRRLRRRKGNSSAIVRVHPPAAPATRPAYTLLLWASVIVAASLVGAYYTNTCICQSHIRLHTPKQYHTDFKVFITALCLCITHCNASTLVVAGVAMQWLHNLAGGAKPKRRAWNSGYGPLLYLCYYLIAHKAHYLPAYTAALNIDKWLDGSTGTLSQRASAAVYSLWSTLYATGIALCTTGTDSTSCRASQDITPFIVTGVLAVELLLTTFYRTSTSRPRRTPRHDAQPQQSTGGIHGLAKSVAESKRKEPLFVECTSGKGGVQGLSVNKQMFTDEDGDLGHEFFKADSKNVSRLVRVSLTNLKKAA